MKWLLSFMVIIPLAGGAAAWHLFGSSGVESAELKQPEPPSAPTIQGIGYVEPGTETRKLMMRAGGVVKRCYFDAGDVVRKGQLMVELDDATQHADVEVASKNLEMLRAEAVHVNVGTNPYKLKVIEQTVDRLREKARHLRHEAERYSRLIERQAVSYQDYDSILTQRRQAEIELREQEAELLHLRNVVTPENRALLAARTSHAQANLEMAEERLRETKLFAPFDGTVLKLLKREGEGVRSFDPEAVILFGDLSKLRVRAEIDERFVTRLKVGQNAEAYGRNLAGKAYAGRIVRLEKIMGDKTVFARASSERKDLNVLQALIEMGPEFTVPVGLQVDVRVGLASD